MNQYKISSLIIFLFLCLQTLVFAEQSTSPKASSKPNVIFIMADDLGRGLLLYYGQEIIKTPAIDMPANEGAVFENAYAGAFCAPSRVAFLTGYSDWLRDNLEIINVK